MEKKPRFDDWLVLMEQKLSANVDHYDSPALRHACVACRREGEAAKHTAKRLRQGEVNQNQVCGLGVAAVHLINQILWELW